jgi:hypothetical protein
MPRNDRRLDIPAHHDSECVAIKERPSGHSPLWLAVVADIIGLAFAIPGVWQLCYHPTEGRQNPWAIVTALLFLVTTTAFIALYAWRERNIKKWENTLLQERRHDREERRRLVALLAEEVDQKNQLAARYTEAVQQLAAIRPMATRAINAEEKLGHLQNRLDAVSKRLLAHFHRNQQFSRLWRVIAGLQENLVSRVSYYLNSALPAGAESLLLDLDRFQNELVQSTWNLFAAAYPDDAFSISMKAFVTPGDLQGEWRFVTRHREPPSASPNTNFVDSVPSPLSTDPYIEFLVKDPDHDHTLSQDQKVLYQLLISSAEAPVDFQAIPNLRLTKNGRSVWGVLVVKSRTHLFTYHEDVEWLQELCSMSATVAACRDAVHQRMKHDATKALMRPSAGVGEILGSRIESSSTPV